MTTSDYQKAEINKGVKEKWETLCHPDRVMTEKEDSVVEVTSPNSRC